MSDDQAAAIVADYIMRTQDVRRKKKEMEEAQRELEKIRSKFKNLYPLIYADIAESAGNE